MAGVLPVTMLRTQYRMHPDICSVVSKHFYNDKLLTAEERDHACCSIGHQPGLSSASAIVWRSHTAEEEEDDITRTSKLNREEARIICQELIPAFLDKGKRIAVITFYKAQQRLLQEMLGEAATVMTVDSAQGSEADVVILSCVRSNKGNNIGHVDNRFRLNVALSRAKDQLVIEGNAACFRRERHTSSPVWQDLWKSAYKPAAIMHGAITLKDFVNL
jgi:senataxin